jgi:DNA-binding transcriptional LysR family regulator
MFDFRDLECFMTVIEHRGFGRGAAALGMTQPALTRRIAALERGLGVSLFSRAQRQIEPTPAGEIFARESMALLGRAQNIRRMMAEASAGSTERLKIGTRSSARYAVITVAIRLFRAERPGVPISLSDPVKLLELEQLRKGEFDIAVVRGPVDLRNGLRSERLRSDPLVVALPAGHRLAGNTVVELGNLAGERFVEIAAHRGYGSKDLVRGALSEAGFRANVVQVVETVDMLVMCVAAGIGVALMYDASRELPIPGIVYRPLRPKQKTIALHAVWRADEGNSAIAPFVRCLKEAAKSLDDPMQTDVVLN